MSASNWDDSALHRFLFRFVFAFLLLFNFPFPLNVIPGVNFDGWTRSGWDVLVQPAGRALFGVSPSAVFTGSGDTRWSWTQLALMLAISLAAAMVWTVWDRRTNYPRLARFLHTYVRFALAYVMLVYGTMKVIPLQFPPPSLDRLIQPFGHASPMGLLWTFMGASAPYVIFTGIGEMLGGLLLTMRRTALLGAVVSAAVMTQVAVLNFCYDVPVKIYSTLLLFEALVLIAYGARRLLFALVPQVPRVAWWKIALRTAAVVAICFMFLKDGRDYGKQLAQRSPLRGIWRVDVLQVNGVDRPPLITDTGRWRRMVFDYPQGISVQLMNDQRHRYAIALKEPQKTFSLTRRDHPNFRASFTYRRPDPQTLVLDGTMEGDRVHVVARREPDTEFLLNTRGFHWINETPFNR
ncbi:MAG TPA: hypothetical protein VEO54_23725 [Thermoanaerobaculia bacterium]|nr:hypothetical protein [Thermoanaerobaculia bacterium]